MSFSFVHRYRTSNGIQAEEQGQTNNLGTEDEGMESKGQYSYTGDDGKIYTVTWTAGRNGFVAVGDHIPKP